MSLPLHIDALVHRLINHDRYESNRPSASSRSGGISVTDKVQISSNARQGYAESSGNASLESHLLQLYHSRNG